MNSYTATSAAVSTSMASFDPSILPSPIVWGILGGAAAIVAGLVYVAKKKDKNE